MRDRPRVCRQSPLPGFDPLWKSKPDGLASLGKRLKGQKEKEEWEGREGKEEEKEEARAKKVPSELSVTHSACQPGHFLEPTAEANRGHQDEYGEKEN